MAGSSSAFPTVDILGCAVATTPADEIDAWLRRSLDDDATCRHVVTLNPEYVMAARRSPNFAAALSRAELATADGVGIVVAARLVHGVHLPRITGVDLVERLAALGADAGAGLFLLGAAPGVADAAGAALAQRYPRLRIVGTWAEGSPAPHADADALTRIAASGASLVAVAYGAPGQVLWIDRNRDALTAAGVRVAIGVGGALDYLSGLTPLPPAWARRSGLEWLVRLVREPWRWRRQLVLPVFALRVLGNAVRARSRR